jgi:hypothetical protein
LVVETVIHVIAPTTTSISNNMAETLDEATMIMDEAAVVVEEDVEEANTTTGHNSNSSTIHG